MDWRAEAQVAAAAFHTVAEVGGAPLQPGELVVEALPAPHRPPSRLPAGTMAVYGFWGDGEWLKIGKAGANSGARYTSQHYNAGSASSTLAASLIKAPPADPSFAPNGCRDWICASTSRVNWLLPAARPRELLSLLEAFLHLRLRPRFEG
jgi:hypothetical protein